MQSKIPLPAPDTQEGRHAGVVPSFAIQCFSPVIKCSAGDFKRESLLAWNGSLPSQLVANAIRESLVKTQAWVGSKGYGSGICCVPTRVRLTPGWQKVLGPSEFAKMEGFVNRLSSEDEFPTLSAFQVRSTLKISIVKTLEILAKFEALYWKNESDKQGDYELQNVSQAWRSSVKSVLQQQWVQSLDGQDIRFPGFVFAALDDWVKTYLQESRLPSIAVAQLNALLKADAMTVEQEVLAIAQAALKYIRKGPEDQNKAKKWIDWFVQVTQDGLYRYPADKTKRILDPQLEGRKAFDTVLYELHSRRVATPRLSNILDKAKRLAPLSIIEAQNKLRPLLGPNYSLLGAMELSDAIGLSIASSNSQIEYVTIAGRENKDDRIAVLKDSGAPPWVAAAAKFLMDECVQVGCTSYARVAGYLADEAHVEVTRDQLCSALQALPGFMELDIKDGWICINHDSKRKVNYALRKMLALNPEGISVSELMDGITVNYEKYNKQYDGYRPGFPVPIHVLELWLASRDWLKRNEKGDFYSAQTIKIDSCLTEEEIKLVGLMENNGGVVLSSEISDAGISRGTIIYSVIFKSVVKGVYSIRGRIVAVRALQNALTRKLGLRRRSERRGGLVEAGSINELSRGACGNELKALKSPKPSSKKKPAISSPDSNIELPKIADGISPGLRKKWLAEKRSLLIRRRVRQKNIHTDRIQAVESWESLDLSREFSFCVALSGQKEKNGTRKFHMNIPGSFLLDGYYEHMVVDGVVLKTYAYGKTACARISLPDVAKLNLPWDSNIRLTFDPVARTFDAVVENEGGENNIHMNDGSTSELSE